MNGGTKQLLKMYMIALLLTLIAEWIGLIKWQFGVITVLLVPFFHTIYLGVAFGPKFLGRFIKVYDVKDSAFAAALITLFAVFFSAAIIAEITLRIQGYPR